MNKELIKQIKEKGLTEDLKKKFIRDLNDQGLTRTFELKQEQIDEKNRQIKDLAFSSDEEYERWFGIEILDHSTGAVRLNRLGDKGAFLSDHNMRQQIGVVEPGTARLDGNKGRATVRFSKSSENKRAQQEWDDVKDSIRTKVSVGYLIHEIKLEESSDSGPDKFRVTDWEPLEISLVSIPADESVGVGREKENHQSDQNYNFFSDDTTNLFKEEIHQSDQNLAEMIKAARSAAGEGVDQNNKLLEKIDELFNKQRSTIMNPQAENTQQPTAEEIKAQRDTEVKEIIKLCNKHNVKVDDILANGPSLEEAKGLILEMKGNDDKPLSDSNYETGIEGKDLSDYSIVRAVKYIMNPHEMKDEATHEIELSKTIADKVGKAPQGLYIPPEAQMKNMRLPDEVRQKVAQRATSLVAGTAGSGAEWVPEQYLSGSFIDLLKNKTLLITLGARFLRGLSGSVVIPKKTSGASASFLAAEGDDVSQSTIGSGKLTMSPKDFGTYVDITRRMLEQGSPDMEALIYDEISDAMGLKLDSVGYHGTGSSGEPTGIVNTSGIGAVTGTSYDWEAALEHEADVDTGNALTGSFAFVTTPTVRSALKSREKWTGTGKPICEMNRVNDYPIYTTNQVNANNVIFGNFGQLMIGEWGGMDIYTDTAVRSGTLTIAVIQSIDLGVRQPAAFSVSTDFS